MDARSNQPDPDRPSDPPLRAGVAGSPFPRLQRLMGLGLIAIWAVWWAESLRQDRLIGASWTTVPALDFLAGDFKVHIDHVARIAAAGIDPYRRTDDPVCSIYPYPPVIARTFAWVALFDAKMTAFLWMSALALIFVTAGLWAARTRRSLGLVEIPGPFAVAAVLFTTPALLAMERGQCDPMVIPALLLAAWLLGRPRDERWPEVVAGALLGVTAWIKYYPGFAAVALLATGRRRGLATFVVVAGLIGVIDREGVLQSIRNGHRIQTIMADAVPYVHPTKHSIVESWPAIKMVHRHHLPRQIPGAAMAALILVPAVLGVSRAMGRATDPARKPLIAPYLLWLTAAGTFGMPYAIDYNLVPLPVMILAVCDRRDRWPLRLVIGLSFLVWEPIALPIGGETLFLIKVAALLASGACLAARLKDRAAVTTTPAVSAS